MAAYVLARLGQNKAYNKSVSAGLPSSRSRYVLILNMRVKTSSGAARSCVGIRKIERRSVDTQPQLAGRVQPRVGLIDWDYIHVV